MTHSSANCWRVIASPLTVAIGSVGLTGIAVICSPDVSLWNAADGACTGGVVAFVFPRPWAAGGLSADCTRVGSVPSTPIAARANIIP